MLEGLLLPILLALLGGGSVIGFLTWTIARRKAPAEVDAIVVQSAETAALSLQKSLAAETARADRLQADNDRKDARIATLEAKIETMQKMLDDMRTELHALQRGD